MTLLIWRFQYWIDQGRSGRNFFNGEASLEIDRLTIEVERLRIENKNLKEMMGYESESR